jgi:hypothetical protein
MNSSGQESSKIKTLPLKGKVYNQNRRKDMILLSCPFAPSPSSIPFTKHTYSNNIRNNTSFKKRYKKQYDTSKKNILCAKCHHL